MRAGAPGSEPGVADGRSPYSLVRASPGGRDPATLPRRHPRAWITRIGPLDPAAVARDQNRLGAVDGADLAVDVVQVGSDRAHRQRQVVGDLLVDLALGEAV